MIKFEKLESEVSEYLNQGFTILHDRTGKDNRVVIVREGKGIAVVLQSFLLGSDESFSRVFYLVMNWKYCGSSDHYLALTTL